MKSSRALRIGAVFAAAVLAGLTLPPVTASSVTRAHDAKAGELAEAFDCEGVAVKPGDNLANVAASKPAGTTFCIAGGAYRVSSQIVVDSRDRFVGESPGSTSVTTTSAQLVFNASRSNEAHISGLDISGATGSKSCHPKCGRGIWPGDNTTVSHVNVHHNAIQGIGGAGPGMLVEHSEIHRNGNEAFFGCCSAGVKSGKSYTIRDSYVHHNIGNGIWCDASCPRFVVLDNVASDNARNGIRYEHGTRASAEEVSKGSAWIARNEATGNNTARSTPGGGIESNSASNVIIENNTLGGTIAAPGVAARGSRHAIKNVEIRDNAMRGDAIKGCSQSGVTCARNS